MSTRHVMLGERVKNPSGQQIRRIVGKSHTASGWKMRPDYLYTVVRAISARVNQNYDGWPSNELRQAAHTFVGKPVFVNHENFDPKKARGVVVAARYVENGRDKYIETVMEIDAKNFPLLAKEIKTGGLDSVSMGAEAGFTICSACGNKAFDEPDMCDHIKYHKGETIRTHNRKTGKVEDKLVYESCHKLGFFELSYVFDPADETAVASKVIMGNRRHVHGANCAPGDPSCAGWNSTLDESKSNANIGLGGSNNITKAIDKTKSDSAPATTGGDSGSQATAPTTPTPAATPAPVTPSSTPAVAKAAMRRAILAKLGTLPPPQNSQATQRPGTMGTYKKVHDYFDQQGAPTDGVLDYGAGLGHSGQWGHTYEPHPREGFEPTYTDPSQVPDGAHGRVTNLNVLNVVPPDIRHQIVDGIGRTMAPGGHAVITTRGRDVYDATNQTPVPGDDGPLGGGVIINKGRKNETYQKGFHPDELHQYVQGRLGPDYTVKKVPLGPAGVHIVRNAGKQASMKDRIANAIWQKVAFGETEAPPEVDTLREEGTAPEDDNDDFHHYVESPPELSNPDTSQAAQIDREQEAGDQAQNTGTPGPNSPEDQQQQPDGVDPDANFMILKVPMPSAAPAAPAAPPVSAQPAMPMAPPMGAPPAPGVPPPAAPPAPGAPAGGAPPAVPMQNFGSKVASQETLAWMESYYGYRVANWRDAIEAGRDLNPEEYADYVREASVETLENRTADSPTSRNPVKGTANMARSTLANRRKTAATSHFAEGPLTDGGDVSRNDEGEQEEAFITPVPASEPASEPTDGQEISNTEGNLVADEAYAHSLTAKLRQQKRELEATAREYARVAGIRTADEQAGGPTPTEVDPQVPTSSAEELTGDNFDSADPNPGIDTSVAGPGTTTLPHESSLQAFRAFDKWLTAGTGKSSRQHSEANIKKAAAQFANYNGISTQALFPALGIALRQARKTEAALKAKKVGTKMQRRAVDLETAAPDDRVSVPAPVADTTDAEAQASQFDEEGWDDNAGKDITDVDLGTGQNFAPGQAPGKSARKADGILAVRCAEAMIAAGLEPNTREAKYQLAAEYQKMSRGLVLNQTALAERFAMVRHADRQKVASGSTRGAARSPIPAGLTQGGSTRTAQTQRVAANNPDNDALLYG